MVTCAISCTMRLVGSPVKSQRQVAQRIGVLLKKTLQLGCVSHKSPQRKSILRDNENGDRISQSFRSENHRSEILRLPISRRDRKTNHYNRRGTTAETAGHWQRMSVNSAKKRVKRNVLLFFRIMNNVALSRKSQKSDIS